MMTPPEPAASRSRKYVVARRLGRWRVTHDDRPIGDFDTAADAARLACDAARLEAQEGCATIVLVQASVMEMHCFTPPVATEAAPCAKLRLVGGAG